MPERRSIGAVEGAPHAEVFAAKPRTVRLRLDAGDEIAEHRHPDRWVLIHVLQGHLSVSVGNDTYDLPAGHVLRFDGDQAVAPRAIEQSTAVVILAPKQDES